MSGDHDDGVPIMSDKREKAIRERAYALWEKSGSKHGQHGEHWDQAVREVDAEAGAAKPKASGKAAPVAPTERRKPGPKPKALSTPAVAPAVKAKPGPKPKAAAAAPVEPPKPAVAAKPATAKPAAVAKPVAVSKAKPAAKPETVSAPAKAVSKAKQAAESVVATVKRAAKGTAKK